MPVTTNLGDTFVNQSKMTCAYETLERLKVYALQRGFYGKVSVELVIQDGTIQEVSEHVSRSQR